MTHRRTYANEEFLKLVEEGRLAPDPLPRGDGVHLHWILVRGRPRWVVSKRRSNACGTTRCEVKSVRTSFGDGVSRMPPPAHPPTHPRPLSHRGPV